MKRFLWLGLLASLPVSSAFCDVQSSGDKHPNYSPFGSDGTFIPTGVKQPIDNSQNGPGGLFYMPKWYSDAIVAANCYQTGMSYISSDPKLAVQAFELGLSYARKAAAEGAGEQIESISMGLSKGLGMAEANLAKDKSGDGSDGAAKNDGSADKDNNNDADGQNQAQVTTTVPKTGGIVASRTGGESTRGSVGSNNSGNASGRSRVGM